MEQDFYTVLGLKKTATQDEIKKSYKKLASKHHPDKGGNEEEFKKVKEAYDILSDKERKQRYDRTGSADHRPGQQSHGMHQGHDLNDIIRRMHEAHRHQQENAPQVINILVPIKEAFTGFTAQINVKGSIADYTVKPGLPNGVSYQDNVQIKNETKQIFVNFRIDTRNFAFKSNGTHDGVHYSGDLITLIEVEALKIYTGAWIIIKDFTDKELQVRIPQGFDIVNELKVAGHGYSNWKGNEATNRGDLYLKIKPVFSLIKDIPKELAQEFTKAINV